MLTFSQNSSGSPILPRYIVLVIGAGLATLHQIFVLLPRHDASQQGTGAWSRTQQPYLSPQLHGHHATAAADDYFMKLGLKDRTIPYSTNVHRVWLDDNNTARGQGLATPLARGQILLTNVGWNHPNQTYGLLQSRSTRSTELMRGVVNHPWFHPTGWEDYDTGRVQPSPHLHYYVFMDVETCFERNWPTYGAGFKPNADKGQNRSVHESKCQHLPHCKALDQLASSPLFKNANISKHVTLVVFDCSGRGPNAKWRHEQHRKEIESVTKPRDLVTRTMAVVSISATNDHLLLNDTGDHGLPPPAVKPANLTTSQQQDIATCRADTNNEARPYLVTFSGNFRDPVRGELRKLHNTTKGVYIFHRAELQQHVNDTTFETMLTQSKFALTPRGDNRFSYRFHEVLSAGAIPVVHSDGWVLPFRHELIDWNDCAVRIPQSRANETLDIISAINTTRRCQMRRRCYEIYQDFFATPEATITGIIEGLERRHLAKKGAGSLRS